MSGTSSNQAAIAVRSLWAAERSCCLTDCWAARCRPRGETCSWDLVAAVNANGRLVAAEGETRAGAMYKQVAKKLDISLNTVRTYVCRIYKKLHVNWRHAAVERFKKMP